MKRERNRAAMQSKEGGEGGGRGGRGGDTTFNFRASNKQTTISTRSVILLIVDIATGEGGVSIYATRKTPACKALVNTHCPWSRGRRFLPMPPA